MQALSIFFPSAHTPNGERERERERKSQEFLRARIRVCEESDTSSRGIEAQTSFTGTASPMETKKTRAVQAESGGKWRLQALSAPSTPAKLT
jgi:hypothetical protein